MWSVVHSPYTQVNIVVNSHTYIHQATLTLVRFQVLTDVLRDVPDDGGSMHL
jgi:hypothetical protein